MLVENIDGQFLAVPFAELSILIYQPLFYVLFLLLLLTRVEFVTQKFQVCLLFTLSLETYSHIGVSVAQRTQFLVDEVRVGEIMHGDRIGVSGKSAFLGDDGHFSGRVLTESARRDGADLSPLIQQYWG